MAALGIETPIVHASMLLLCLPCLISFEQHLHKTHIVIGLARVEFGIPSKSSVGKPAALQLGFSNLGEALEYCTHLAFPPD